jgi:hypothetical protein
MCRIATDAPGKKGWGYFSVDTRLATVILVMVQNRLHLMLAFCGKPI